MKLHRETRQWEDSDPPKKDYESELAAGARPVFQPGIEHNTILLDNNTVFQKVLQPTYPEPPEKYMLQSKKDLEISPPSQHPVQFHQGHLRWLDFPQPVEVNVSLEMCCRS